MIRILNHLLIFREFDYSLTDIARESDVAWSTLNLLWSNLEKKGLVVHTRNVGKAKMYRLDTKKTIVKNLIQFADTLVLDYAEPKRKKIEVLIYSAGHNYLNYLPALYPEGHNYLNHLFMSFAIEMSYHITQNSINLQCLSINFSHLSKSFQNIF